MPKPKTDALLAEAVELARAELTGSVPAEQVGDHVSAVAEEDRLLTHRFAAVRPGYRGWEWYVTVARAPRSKKVTVCESGLLPGAEALLAPAWVPWAERLDEQERAEAGPAAADQPAPAAESEPQD